MRPTPRTLQVECSGFENGGKRQGCLAKIRDAIAADGSTIVADFQLAGGASVLFDAVYVALTQDAADLRCSEAVAVSSIHAAFAHLNVIGASESAQSLLDATGVIADRGVIVGGKAASFLEVAANSRVFDRESTVRTTY